MPRALRRPQSTRSPRQTTDGRGIGSSDVDRAADALLREGERPTIERIRARLGRGSPNTINPLLDAWWKRLAGRLDAGPAALHRLPEPVLLAAEGLWMQTLDEARRRAAAEQGSRKASLAKDRQDLEVRSHVLSIRESELDEPTSGQRPPDRPAGARAADAGHVAPQGASLARGGRSPSRGSSERAAEGARLCRPAAQHGAGEAQHEIAQIGEKVDSRPEEATKRKVPIRKSRRR